MPFIRESLSDIYNRMKSDIENRLEIDNWISRNIILPIMAVCAGVFYLQYGFLVRLSKQFFFTTADEEYVEWHAYKYGMSRKAATFATGEVRFTGEDTTNIPQETEIQTADGLIFITDELATISGGIADVEVTAKKSGTEYNVDVTTMELVESITNIDDTVSIIESPNGAIDQETIEDLISRLLQRTQNPPGSGNKTDYERWALEVDGIGRAWVFGAEDWIGAGTVGVIIATKDLTVVSSTVKNNVITNVTNKKPLGAQVTVEDPTFIKISIIIKITPYTDYYKEKVNEKMKRMFLLESGPATTIKISSIRKAITEAGVSDYEITYLFKEGISMSIADLEFKNLETATLYVLQIYELT
jgi:uncharacterized phage protein gp47/JayE